MFVPLSGTFWRSVDAAYVEHALGGSVRPGRYSRADQPSLYLSATPEGVEAAMKAHSGPNDPPKVLIEVEVSAQRLFDLRDLDACAAAGIDRAAALTAWQEIVRNGGEAPSWAVSDRLRALGAEGLIDPARNAPGLWHLVLFQWNVPGGPTVRFVR